MKSEVIILNIAFHLKDNSSLAIKFSSVAYEGGGG